MANKYTNLSPVNATSDNKENNLLAEGCEFEITSVKGGMIELYHNGSLRRFWTEVTPEILKFAFEEV
jgi:hypothetical protein